MSTPGRPPSTSANSSPRVGKTNEHLKSSTFLDRFPPWVSSNVRSRRSWKMLARCWIASWVAFIIMLPNKSVKTLGNAAFFALIGSLMVPPNMPVQLFIFALLLLVLGLCFGWAFGAAGMRAALAVRNQVLLKAELQKAAESAAGLADPDAVYEASIFKGDFLDTRSTVMFGVFLGIATFLFGLVRAYAPRLTLLSVFGTIAVDIFCSYGPLFPFALYTLLNSLLTSLACYIAIGLIIIVFVFPETLNHAVLTSASGVLEQMHKIIEVQDEVLTAPEDELVEGGTLRAKVAGDSGAMIAGVKGFISQLAFLNLEFSWGRWNGDDIKALEKPFAGLVGRLAALQGFTKLLRWSLVPTNASLASLSKPIDEGTSTADNAMGDMALLRQLQSHDAHSTAISVAEIIPILYDATRELREACAGAIASCKAVVDSVNTKRYARRSTADLNGHLEELDSAAEKLAKAIDSFKERDRLAILEPFKSILDAAGSKEQSTGNSQAPFRSLYIAFVFTSNLVAVGQATKTLLEVVGATAHKRSRNRLWAPKGLRAIGKVLTQRGDAGEQAMGEDPAPPKEEQAQDMEENVYRLDPDGRPPSNVLQQIANTGHIVYIWAKTPEAMFAFKYVFLTIAIWIPAVCKPTAHFMYAQKGLWALIMAQTTLNIYAADQVWNLVSRSIGTGAGLIFGLLCWYIGSAKSNGSPYGMAASVAVFLIPLLFFRIFAPMQYLSGVITGGATWALIVGYSWLDGHIAVLGNVGIGWPVAWRRFVLVVVGFAASFIMMILPPTSARKSVRLRCASTISSLSYLYSHLMSAWINDEEPAEMEKGSSQVDVTSKWVVGYRERFISVAQQIQLLKTQTSIARFEGNMRGAWPSEEYNRLVEVESEMASNLAMLGGSLAQLDYHTRMALLRHTKVVNPNFISEVMSTFLIVSQALRTGEPLHQAQNQNLVERVFYHGDMPYPSGTTDQDLRKDSQLQHLQSISSYEYMFYASGVVSVFRLLQNLNEVRTITARLCGEVPLEGFQHWKEKYDREYTLV